jgi:hypothetical protein
VMRSMSRWLCNGGGVERLAGGLVGGVGTFQMPRPVAC